MVVIITHQTKDYKKGPQVCPPSMRGQRNVTLYKSVKVIAARDGGGGGKNEHIMNEVSHLQKQPTE